MKKKIMSLFLVITVMAVGIMVVSAASINLNVTSSTVLTKSYTAKKANLLSMITSDGYGAGTPGTYIRAYLLNGSVYTQKLGFHQDVGKVGYVTLENGYVGIGTWRLRLYGKNQETSLSYADWSGNWVYTDQ